MKRRALGSVFALLLITNPAHAVAIFAGGKPVLVHEDFVFLHQDTATNRIHVLYAARVAPAFVRVSIGFPTPTSPVIKQVVVDLPDALHKLISPHEFRLNKRPPAAPAPWTTGTSLFDSFVEDARTGDQSFDPTWTKSYVDKGFFIAGLHVKTHEDGRLEVLSPTAHISFTSERFVLARREPPIPIQDDDHVEAGVPDKPRQPFEVTVSKVEPSQVGPPSETIAEILQNHPSELLGCYARFLERNPDAGKTLGFDTTIRPKGDVVAIKMLESQTDVSSKEFGSCVTNVFKNVSMPRADDGYTFQSSITFKPPRIPARRTHVVTIGSSKYVWRDRPTSVRLEHDFEILPEDLKNAFPADLRNAFDLHDNDRVWVSHWLDRSTRRTQADDAEFETQDLPARGEPGALPIDVHDTHISRDTPQPAESTIHTKSKKNRHSFPMLGAVAGVLTVALWMARNELRD